MPDPEPTQIHPPVPSEVVVYQPSKMEPTLAFLPGAGTAEHSAVLWGLSSLQESIEDESDQAEHQEVLERLNQGDTDGALGLLEHLFQGKFITLNVWDPNRQEEHA